MNRLYDLLTRFFFYSGSVAYALLVIVLFASVISRYCLGHAFSWSEEINSFLFLWVSYIGIVLAMENDSHLRVDTLLIYMKGKVRRVFDIINYIIIICFSLVLCCLGADLVLETMDMEQYAITVPVSIALVSLAIPIAFFFMGLYAFKHLVAIIKSTKQK